MQRDILRSGAVCGWTSLDGAVILLDGGLGPHFPEVKGKDLYRIMPSVALRRPSPLQWAGAVLGVCALVLALLGKMVACPLILAGMLHFVELPELMEKVFIIQSGLPCMMQISILSAYYKTDAEFGALMVSLSTLISAVTIPVAMTLLSL